MEEILKVEHLVKDFGTNKVLKDIDFSVYKGDVISIIGSSGSGKSTLLRCINMLEDATGGSIFYHGKDILKGGVNEDAFRTKVGMVFQFFKEGFCLFLRVFENPNFYIYLLIIFKPCLDQMIRVKENSIPIGQTFSFKIHHDRNCHFILTQGCLTIPFLWLPYVPAFCHALP